MFENQNHSVAQSTEYERVQFYKKTYLNVSLGVAVFVFLEYIMLNTPPIVNMMLSLQGYSWLFLLLGFMGVTWFAQNLTYNATNRPMQYLGYFIYIIAQALIFIPILHIALYYSGGPDMILQAGIVTAAMFFGLTAAVLLTNKDFSFLRTTITIGSFIALGLLIAGLIFGFNLGLWFSVGMVVLASGSILYQTSQIKNDFHTSQYVPAALSLFASLMLLFFYILRIFMSRD